MFKLIHIKQLFLINFLFFVNGVCVDVYFQHIQNITKIIG